MLHQDGVKFVKMHESYLSTIKDIQFMENYQIIVIAVGTRNDVGGIALQFKN